MKAGRTGAGSQRYRCGVCQRRYSPQPKEPGYPEALRHQAVQLYVDGSNYRQVGRQLGVDHVTVMHWVRAHVARLPPPVPDELHTFVGSKKTFSS